MNAAPRMISNTVIRKQVTYQCFFEIESEVHTIYVVIEDNKVKECLRHGEHTQLSISSEQWQLITSEVESKLIEV